MCYKYGNKIGFTIVFIVFAPIINQLVYMLYIYFRYTVYYIIKHNWLRL